METPSPAQEGGEDPSKFSAHVYCGQTAGWIEMTLGMEVGLSRRDFVLDGEPAAPPKGGGALKFSAHVYCDQTAAWIRMPRGLQIGLSPSDTCLLYTSDAADE